MTTSQGKNSKSDEGAASTDLPPAPPPSALGVEAVTGWISQAARRGQEAGEGGSSSRKGPKAPRGRISAPHEGAGAPTGDWPPPEPQAKPAEEAFPTGAPSLGRKYVWGSFQQIQPLDRNKPEAGVCSPS